MTDNDDVMAIEMAPDEEIFKGCRLWDDPECRPSRLAGVSDWEWAMANLAGGVARDTIPLEPMHFEALADARQLRTWALNYYATSVSPPMASLIRTVLPAMRGAELLTGLGLLSRPMYGPFRMVFSAGILDAKGDENGTQVTLGQPFQPEPGIVFGNSPIMAAFGTGIESRLPPMFILVDAGYRWKNALGGAVDRQLRIPGSYFAMCKLGTLRESSFDPDSMAMADYQLVGDRTGVTSIGLELVGRRLEAGAYTQA